ncbi:MAG TPA: hypothetical protein VMF60_06450 [Acidimicrobiales bacterium]|nr:hypothetical protein [Acidimicrobiales bacterium]
MKLTPMPLCPGTVIVHRDDAMTCTSHRCPKQLTRGDWFKIHSSFVPCSVAHGGAECPDCEFGTVVVDLAQRLRARSGDHPSMQPAVDDEDAPVIPLRRTARVAR